MLDILKNYFFLLRLDKPIGVYLLLWPSLSAVWLASEGKAELLIILVFCLGSFFMRSAGVIINDYLDQDIDRKVLRTFNRPIANNSVSILLAISIKIFVSSFIIYLFLFNILFSFFKLGPNLRLNLWWINLLVLCWKCFIRGSQ